MKKKCPASVDFLVHAEKKELWWTDKAKPFIPLCWWSSQCPKIERYFRLNFKAASSVCTVLRTPTLLGRTIFSSWKSMCALEKKKKKGSYKMFHMNGANSDPWVFFISAKFAQGWTPFIPYMLRFKMPMQGGIACVFTEPFLENVILVELSRFTHESAVTLKRS